MNAWLINPRDPLIFRDGKPFTATPGERAKSLLFPYPSTVAGAMRSLAGMDAATGKFEVTRIPELLQKSVRGPVLVEVDEADLIRDWFFPAPADALLIQAEPKGSAMRYRLRALDSQGFSSDLVSLSLTGPSKIVKIKPLSNPPRYWNRKAFEAWLLAPEDGMIFPDEIGIQGPRREFRTHVSISAETQTAKPGALFQTSGMEFVEVRHLGQDNPELQMARSLALALETDAEVREGLDVLGGERRAVRWQKSNAPLPECPAEIMETILSQGACRLILLTPACFEIGCLPEWLTQKYAAQVLAAALPRYQTISGWDYEQARPKPTRRLAAAGSVFFLKFNENNNIQAFIQETWMQTVSDKDQDRRDGFGLAALGTWDGNLEKMEVN